MNGLTDDEYSCLMIMAEGENLIAMRDTRWYTPLMLLHAKDFCKSIGNNNYVVTQRGRAALIGHEETLSGGLRQFITKHGQINEQRQAMHSRMQEILAEVVESAKFAALTTGSPEITCLRQIMQEIELRAGEILK